MAGDEEQWDEHQEEEEEQEEEAQDPPDDEVKVQKIAIRAPTFTENSPSNWFRSMEAQFKLNGITKSTTKHLYVLSMLTTDVMDNVPDEILEGKSYKDLKSSIIDFYTKSKAEMFERLLSKTAMTGRPSAYLRSIQKIGKNIGISDDLLRHKFVQNLPPNIGTALAAQKSLTLTEMGKMADDLVPTFDVSHINTVSNNSNWTPHSASKNFNYNSSSSSNNYRNNGRDYDSNQSNNNIPIGLRPYGSTQKPKICRAHLYFADKARTCKPWCRFPGPKKNLSMQPSSRASSPARGSAEN